MAEKPEYVLVEVTPVIKDIKRVYVYVVGSDWKNAPEAVRKVLEGETEYLKCGDKKIRFFTTDGIEVPSELIERTYVESDDIGGFDDSMRQWVESKDKNNCFLIDLRK